MRAMLTFTGTYFAKVELESESESRDIFELDPFSFSSLSDSLKDIAWYCP